MARGRRSNKIKEPSPTENESAIPTSLSALMTQVILRSGFATEHDEVSCIVESIFCDWEVYHGNLIMEEFMAESLQEYFDISLNQAHEITSASCHLPSTSEDLSIENEDDLGAVDVNEEGDGDLIGPGECELCERYISLTKHHLIPRSTWKKLTPRLLDAKGMLESNYPSEEIRHVKVRKKLGDALYQKLVPFISIIIQPTTTRHTKSDNSNKQREEGRSAQAIKHLLQETCSICRHCHSYIHNTHDNWTLATEYNTTELLLQDEAIFKYCHWASKQKPGKYRL